MNLLHHRSPPEWVKAQFNKKSDPCCLSLTTNILTKDKQLSPLKWTLTSTFPTHQRTGKGITVKCHTQCQTLFSGLRHNEQPCGPPFLFPLLVFSSLFSFPLHTVTTFFLFFLFCFSKVCLFLILSHLSLLFCHCSVLCAACRGLTFTRRSCYCKMVNSEQRHIWEIERGIPGTAR